MQLRFSGDARTAAEAAEAACQFQEAELLLLRAIRMSRDDGEWDYFRSKAEFVLYSLRHRPLRTAAAMVRDLLIEGEAMQCEARRPLEIILFDGREDIALEALRIIRPEEVLHCWWLLRAAERCSKDSKNRLAAKLALAARAEATARDDMNDVWRAEGQLGRVYEREGRIHEAVRLWEDAFNEGSSNRLIADRLSLYLEREKRYQRCADVIQIAISRIDDPRAVDSLRRRLSRVS